MAVHVAILIGSVICFGLMIGFAVFNLSTAWFYGSTIVAIEQLFLFIISMFYHFDILIEISYPLSILIQTLSLFVINVIINTVSLTHYIAVTMISLWSIRLSVYLTLRTRLKQREIEHYSRFDSLWENRMRLFAYLLFQYLTIFVNNLASICIFYFDLSVINDDNNVDNYNYNINVINIVSIVLFIFGLIISSIADYDKYKLYLKNTNCKYEIWKFSLLWRICRRINYVGDMIIFWSIWLLCIDNIFYNKKYILLITILGPIHVTLALLWFSNVFEKNDENNKINETESNEKQTAYYNYKARTPYFLPFVCIKIDVEPKNRIGFGLGMYEIACKHWNVN